MILQVQTAGKLPVDTWRGSLPGVNFESGDVDASTPWQQ
jgi:hypothetical protein